MINQGHEPRFPEEKVERSLRALALATLVSTYLLIVLGSTVRVTESGMGCNGWPLCSGQIGPIDHFHPLLEQSHRYLASIVTLLIFAFAIATWRAGRRAYHLRGLALAGIGIICVQVALGAVTVLTNNAPATVALHLIVGLVFLATVTATTIKSFAGNQSTWRPTSDVDKRSLWALAGLFFVLVSGSLVVDGEAEQACPSWPACFGSHSPAGLVDLQLIHRVIVLVGAALVADYAIRIVRNRDLRPPMRRLGIAVLSLLALQIAAGAVVAVLRAPDVPADIHLALAAALWTTLVALVALGALRARQFTNIE